MWRCGMYLVEVRNVCPRARRVVCYAGAIVVGSQCLNGGACGCGVETKGAESMLQTIPVLVLRSFLGSTALVRLGQAG